MATFNDKCVPDCFRRVMRGTWVPNWEDLIQSGTVDDIAGMLIERRETVEDFFESDAESITTAKAELSWFLTEFSETSYKDRKGMFRCLGLGKPERQEHGKGI